MAQESGSKAKKTVVITGCDSGIGEALCRRMVNTGYTAVISYLNRNPFEGDERVRAQRMDLRVPDEAHRFCQFVSECCAEGHRLECLVNNAGIALGGPIENIPLSYYRESFEINFFGLLAITQGLIPMLIQNQGRILIVGSMAGRIAMPFLSPYVATKFALEGFCDSLRRELKPFGVTTVLVEPSAVATPIWNKAKQQDITFADPKYSHSLMKFQEKFIEGGNRGISPDATAQKISQIILVRNPKPRYIVAGNRLVASLPLWIPARLLDRVVAGLFEMQYGFMKPQK